MESIYIYFLKANGLLLCFYLIYYFLLSKETFFVNNRYFLLFGLATSLLLPFLTFTKTIWIEASPVFTKSITPILSSGSNTILVTERTIDWNILLLIIYFGISTVLILKILFEIISFYRFISVGKREKYSGYTLIDNPENNNPFSFLNYIIINKNVFSSDDFNHIITHEKVHVSQNHSLDIIFSKLICCMFWLNPIVWMYKKSMLQNLEFIADDAACLQSQNRINYQKTLLKVVTNPHQLTITNQFYQSLIKKRIVMLNKNRSHQKQSWKYVMLFPAIALFIFLFQIETVAQEKEKTSETKTVAVTTQLASFGVITLSTSSDEELKADTEYLKKEGIDYKVSKIKRNSKGEIIGIKIEFDDHNGKKGISETSGENPIEPIFLNIDLESGKTDFTEAPNMEDFVVNEKIAQKLGYEVKVTTVNNFPTPPTPPRPPKSPISNLDNVPSNLIFPPAPKAPKGTPLTNEKAWNKFEKQMEEYSKNIEKMNPEIEAFAIKMADFEEKMKPFEKEMEVFDIKMQEFEKKMEVYEQEMKTYQKNRDTKK